LDFDVFYFSLSSLGCYCPGVQLANRQEIAKPAKSP
jgi:hypothetical protein